MKKLVSISLLVSLTVMCNAQENNKPKYSDLNQDQLNFALKQASKTVKTGKILAFVGAGAFTTGVILMTSGVGDIVDGDSNPEAKIGGGYVLFLGGFVSTVIGVPVWIVGANKKNKIELELVKFKTLGSSSINGIGLKIKF
jgi:hypothetical protein